MMRNQRQDHPLQIVSPVPDAALSQAARLWWGAIGHGWGPAPRIRACHGIVALDDTGGVAGVIGLRDAQGGFLAATPLGARIAFRAAPSTADLVVDGIVVRDARQGIGGALLRQALVRATLAGHPGLRAEVRVQNSGAMEFYRAMGFAAVAQGRFGWPWTGQVMILRRAVDNVPEAGSMARYAAATGI